MVNDLLVELEKATKKIEGKVPYNSEEASIELWTKLGLCNSLNEAETKTFSVIADKIAIDCINGELTHFVADDAMETYIFPILHILVRVHGLVDLTYEEVKDYIEKTDFGVFICETIAKNMTEEIMEKRKKNEE